MTDSKKEKAPAAIAPATPTEKPKAPTEPPRVQVTSRAGGFYEKKGE
ncbi:MAG: hypothetical protein OEY28_06120 [Nitrospira sp.]|nr:hypothetical protein [Nitrospira sp.]